MVGAISDGLGQAYVIADSLRMSLASQRQKMVAELDNQSKEDGVDPGECLMCLSFHVINKNVS